LMTGRLDESGKGLYAGLTSAGLVRADHRLGNARSASHVCLGEPGARTGVAEHGSGCGSRADTL
jgi:hypothetical protein